MKEEKSSVKNDLELDRMLEPNLGLHNDETKFLKRS